MEAGGWMHPCRHGWYTIPSHRVTLYGSGLTRSGQTALCRHKYRRIVDGEVPVVRRSRQPSRDADEAGSELELEPLVVASMSTATPGSPTKPGVLSLPIAAAKAPAGNGSHNGAPPGAIAPGQLAVVGNLGDLVGSGRLRAAAVSTAASNGGSTAPGAHSSTDGLGGHVRDPEYAAGIHGTPPRGLRGDP
jgi:hypothetical protein